MGKKKEVTDDGEGDETTDLRAVFIDTSLDTRMALLVSKADTVSDLKQKLALEHCKCFPNFGNIEINALKVKRKADYYHLCDSMLLRTVFSGVAKTWFLSADVSSWNSNCHNSHGTPKRLPAPPRTNPVTQVLDYPCHANQTVHTDGSPNLQIVVNCKNDANFRSSSSETGKKSGQCRQKVPDSPGKMHEVRAVADENKEKNFKTPMSEGSFVYSGDESLTSRTLVKGKRSRGRKRVAVDGPAAAGGNVGGRDAENQQATGIAPMGADNNAVPDANEENAQKAAEVGSNQCYEHKSKTDLVIKQSIDPVSGGSKISETHADLKNRASSVDRAKESEGVPRTEQAIQNNSAGKKKRRVLKDPVLLEDNSSVDAKSKAQLVEVLNENCLADVGENRNLNDDIGQHNYTSTAGIEHEIKKTENMPEQANFDNKNKGDPLTEIKSLLCGSDMRQSVEFINKEISREPIRPEGVTDTSHGDDGTTLVREVAESDAKNLKKRKKTGADASSKTQPLPFSDESANLKEDVFHRTEPTNTDLENEAFENNAKLLISEPSVSVIKEMQNDVTQTKLPLSNTNVNGESSSTPRKRGKRAKDSGVVHQTAPSITTSGKETLDNRFKVIESSENKSKKVTPQQMSIGEHQSFIPVKKRDNARGASRSKSAKPSLKSLPKETNLEYVENGKVKCEPSNPGPSNEAVDPALVSALAAEETEDNNNKPEDMSLKLGSEGEGNHGDIQKQAVSEDPQPNVVFAFEAESDMQSSKAGVDNEFVHTDSGNIVNGQGVANISQLGEMQTFKLAEVSKFGETAEIKSAKLGKKSKKQQEFKASAKNLSDFPLGEQEQTLKLAELPKFGENPEIKSAKLGKKTKKQQESKATAKMDRSAKMDRGESKMASTDQSAHLKNGGVNGAEFKSSTPGSALAYESDMKSFEKKAEEKSLRNHSTIVDHQKETHNVCQSETETPQPTPVRTTDEDMKVESEMPKKKTKKLKSSNIKKNPSESSVKEQGTKAKPDELDHERSVAKKKPEDSTSTHAPESDMENPETKADDKSLRDHSINVDKTYQRDLETLQPTPAPRPAADRKDESEKPRKKTKKLQSSNIKKSTPESSCMEQDTKAKPDDLDNEQSVAKKKLRDSTSALASESNMNSSETKADDKSLRNPSVNVELLKKTENIFQSDSESHQPTPDHRIGKDRKDESEKPKKNATKLQSSNMKRNPPASSLKERDSKAKLDELEHESSVEKKKHGDSALQSGSKASKSAEETVVPKFQADPVKSKNVSKKRTALEFSGISGANAGASSISGTLSARSNKINQPAHQVRKATRELPGLSQLPVGNGASSNKIAKTVRKSPQKKSLVNSSGSIFNKESSSSSEEYDEEENEGSDSDCSTRTPSEPSSSDYSEGESKDVTKDGSESKALNSQDSNQKRMSMELLLKSSSNFKKAKVVASQAQLEYSEPVDFVPDSQGIL